MENFYSSSLYLFSLRWLDMCFALPQRFLFALHLWIDASVYPENKQTCSYKAFILFLVFFRLTLGEVSILWKLGGKVKNNLWTVTKLLTKPFSNLSTKMTILEWFLSFNVYILFKEFPFQYWSYTDSRRQEHVRFTFNFHVRFSWAWLNQQTCVMRFVSCGCFVFFFFKHAYWWNETPFTPPKFPKWDSIW